MSADQALARDRLLTELYADLHQEAALAELAFLHHALEQLGTRQQVNAALGKSHAWFSKRVRALAERAGVRVCVSCGCTEVDPCVDGHGSPCAWAAADLCTACEPGNLVQGGRRPKPSTLSAVDAEVERARAKFPGTEKLLAALMEEVGELAQAMLQRKSEGHIAREALQAAAVAIRLYEEGDSDFDRETWDAAP